MAKWEIRIERRSEQTHGGKTRTVGTYQVYHDGQPATGTIRIGDKDVPLSGTTAEAPGPSQNAKRASEGFPTRIVAKAYPMQSSGGPTYVTHGYRQDETIADGMPGLELTDTGRRTDILIHPGKNEFRSSVGCVNLCTHLKTPDEIISYPGSRRRVIALIKDMEGFLGPLPGADQAIPNASVLIDERALTQPDTLAANATHVGNATTAAAASTPAGIGWPLRRNVIRGNVRNHTFGKVRNGGTKPHQGWDMLAPIGTECFAIADGKIQDVYESTAYGEVIELSFRFKNQNLFAAYAHLSAVKVKKGDAVTKGQVIGLTGDSGNAANLNRSEMHLHFEVRTQSRPGLGLGGRIDPTKVFGTCPLKEAIFWSPDGKIAASPQAEPGASPALEPKPGASNVKPAAMDRKPIFDAARIMLGRSFKAAEVAALDTACDLASASVPFDRRPLFDAVRIMLGRGFSVAEVTALDAACDVALTSAEPPPGS